MAYQRTTKAQGFRQRVVPTNEVKQYTDLAKSLEKERVTSVKGFQASSNEQIKEMGRLSTLQNQEDVYELANLRQFSKTLNNTLETVAKQVIKPITQAQIQDGVNTAVRCQQGDQEACELVKLNDEQELAIQAQVAKQRAEVTSSADQIEQSWDEAGYTADLEQKYRLLDLKRQNSNFAIGYRRGMLMEAATGWDAYRDSILTGSSDDPIVNREVEHEGELYKVSDYYNIQDPKIKEKIVGSLQNEYIARNGAGLSKIMVNKYLTDKVVERTNIFNQNEFNKGQREWANTQLEYYADQFLNFTFSDLDSESGETTAQLGVQEFLNTSPSIMEAMGVEGSRNAAAKAKLIDFIIDTLKSDNFKNVDDSEELLSFLEKDKFYIAGISKKLPNGEYELSSLSDLFGSDLDTDSLRAELLEEIASDARKTLNGKRIQLNEALDKIFRDNGNDKVGYELALGELYQDEKYYGKYWANKIFSDHRSGFVVTPPLDEEASRKIMKNLEEQYDTKNGGKISIYNVNTQRIAYSVLQEYKDKNLFGDPYEGDESAKKLHDNGVAKLGVVITDLLEGIDIGTEEKKLQKEAFISWVTPKIMTVATEHAKLTDGTLKDGISYAVTYFEQKLRYDNGKLENFPVEVAVEDKDGLSLTLGKNGFSNEIYSNNIKGLTSTDYASELYIDTIQKADDAVSNNNGYIFKNNVIVSNSKFFKITDEGRPQPIFSALSMVDPLTTHPAIIHNDQLVANGLDPIEWNEEVQKEIAEWKVLSADSRKALVSNDDIRFNTALRNEGFISLTDLTQTLITPDGSIPVSESEYSSLLIKAGVENKFTYDEFLARPDLVERAIKRKMFDGLALIQDVTNNNNETIRRLTAYMITGDIDNWNKGDFKNYTLEALNAYHSGNNERLNSIFNKNGLSLNSFRTQTPFNRDVIDTDINSVLNIDLTTVTNSGDLQEIVTRLEELEVPEQKINIREYTMNDDPSGIGVGPVSHQLRRILGLGWEREPNPEYARYIKFKANLEDKLSIMKVLESDNKQTPLTRVGNFVLDSFLSVNFVDPNKILDYQFYPAVENIIGDERLNTIKEKALKIYNVGETDTYEDALFELIRREPEFNAVAENEIERDFKLDDTQIIEYGIGGVNNGRVPENLLVEITGTGNSYKDGERRTVFIRKDAFPSFYDFINEGVDNGVFIGINDGYRSIEQQTSLYNNRKESAVQPPGQSNHGAGISLDLNFTIQGEGNEGYEWIKENARKHGLCPHKNIMAESGESGNKKGEVESWHFTWSPTGTCSEAQAEN